jgi:YfiH family protein
MARETRPGNPQVERTRARPQVRAGVAFWRGAGAGAAFRFVGRGGEGAAEGEAIVPARLERAWLRQVHSARVVDAAPGECGEGDALIVERPGLAALVRVADCVPVLLAGGGRAAAVHAGWRGIAAGVVEAAVERLGAPELAWIGPAIGPCCYEVGPEVAQAVEAASRPGLARAGPRGRPHLDLGAAVATQLARAGVARIVQLAHCTRCRPEWLASYRRDGAAAGRNLAWIWIEAAG